MLFTLLDRMLFRIGRTLAALGIIGGAYRLDWDD